MSGPGPKHEETLLGPPKRRGEIQVTTCQGEPGPLLQYFGALADLAQIALEIADYPEFSQDCDIWQRLDTAAREFRAITKGGGK